MAKRSRSATAPKLPSAASPTPTEVISRHISAADTAMLWGRAAGRCEFAGCNRPLWKSTITQESVNVAQRAHIYSFSDAGPRGHDGIDVEELNAVENLMLMCHQCHKKIDKEQDGGRCTVDVLRAMKRAHEGRIELVTGIDTDRRSHVIVYGANIGQQSSPLNFNDAAVAMFPEWYPAADRAFELGLVNSAVTDRDKAFWETECRQLETLFERQVKERINAGEIGHLSVFAIAPQPLLIRLGTMLCDIVPAAVYQRHREPATWKWPDRSDDLAFNIAEPETTTGSPALVLGVSATVTPDRITAVLGKDASIWTVTVPTPHNDVIKSTKHTAQFRAELRQTLDRIKAVHGQTTTLHVFPAVPVSLAVEFGRIRMPKADMPWLIYDQNNALGGFVTALTISP